jgi:hypothetical protein
MSVATMVKCKRTEIITDASAQKRKLLPRELGENIRKIRNNCGGISPSEMPGPAHSIGKSKCSARSARPAALGNLMSTRLRSGQYSSPSFSIRFNRSSSLTIDNESPVRNRPAPRVKIVKGQYLAILAPVPVPDRRDAIAAHSPIVQSKLHHSKEGAELSQLHRHFQCESVRTRIHRELFPNCHQ